MADEAPADASSAEGTAARVAPVIDDLRLTAARRTMQLSAATGLIDVAGVEQPAFALLLMMRNAFPDRLVPREHLAAPFVYQPPGTAARLLDALAGAGLLQENVDLTISLTDSGRTVMQQLHSLAAQAVAELWDDEVERAQSLLPLVERALHKGATSAGPGFALMTPTYDAPGASPQVQLSERLAGLRFHRFDAHVGAWTDAGFTAATVQALTPGAERDALEAETNRRTGACYGTLEPIERNRLLNGLESLRR